MSTHLVATYYDGVNCNGVPVHVDFYSGNCSANNFSPTDCNKHEEDRYSLTCYDSTLNSGAERLEVALEIFLKVPVLLVDRFDDKDCEVPAACVAYIADGKCYNFYEAGGLTANITDDGANFRAFDKSILCEGAPSSAVSVDTEALNGHSCTKTYGHWVRTYAATTDSSSSTSNSGSASTRDSGSGSVGGSSTASPQNEATSGSSSASTGGPSTSSKINTGAVIGIVAAIILVVAVVIGSIIYCIRARRKKTTEQTTLEMSETQGRLWEDDTILVTRIPRAKVTLITLISRGGYGEVYRGSFDGQLVAIKTLPSHSKRDLQLVNVFLAEAKLMASLDHPHIVTFVGVAWNSLTDLCVVSEFVDNGDLRSTLDSYDANHHPTGFDFAKIKIALHVAHALTYLHSLQPMVLHRDLKSRNILLTHEMDAKLTDFGVSRTRGDATMTAGVGTSLWMAPEVLLGHRYDEKADIFSFGVVLSELDSHTLPYTEAKVSQSGHKMSDTAILQMVSMGRLRVQFSKNAMPLMEDLGLSCVAMDPTSRPSAAELLHWLQTCLKAC